MDLIYKGIHFRLVKTVSLTDQGKVILDFVYYNSAKNLSRGVFIKWEYRNILKY